MEQTRELICVSCPIGCQLTVSLKDGKVTRVIGNSCKKGIRYAEDECVNPVRILTTTVRVKEGMLPVVPVRSAGAISKGLISACMAIINTVAVNAPISIGEVVVSNILNTGIDIISSRNLSLARRDGLRNQKRLPGS